MNGTDKIRIFHLDDEASYTGIIRLILSDFGEQFELVGSANKVSDCFAYLKEHGSGSVDIVLVDLEMPKGGGGDGFEVIERLCNAYPSIKTAILTTHNVWDLANAAIKIGVNGFLLKESSAEKIAGYMVEIAQGGRVIDSGIKDNEWPTQVSKLTEEEIEVVHLLMEELSSAEMVKKMARKGKIMDVSTIDRIRKTIATKLNCEGSYGIAKYALKNGVFLLERGFSPDDSLIKQESQFDTKISEESFLYKVFIVDNHKIFSTGLEILLSNNKILTIEVVACTRDERECMQRLDEISETLPHMLLVNCNLSSTNIPQFIEKINEIYPEIKVVAILPNPDQLIEKTLIEHGAHSVLDRRMDAAKLLDLLLEILKKNERKTSVPTIEYENLNPIDLEILRGILEEKDSQTIATALYANELSKCSGLERRKHLIKLARRIDTKRSHMIRLTGSKNSIGLIKYAWKKYMF